MGESLPNADFWATHRGTSSDSPGAGLRVCICTRLLGISEVPQDLMTSVDTTLVDRKQDRNLEPSMFLPLVYETFPITLSKLYQQTSKKRKTVFPNLCAMKCSLTVHYQIRTLHCIFTLLRVSAYSIIKGSEKSCSKHICHLHFIQGSPHVHDYKAFLPLIS